MARLRRVDCSGPGIVRRRRGRGFEFVDSDGNRVDDPEVIARIAELAVPPAWKEVWICPYPMGHIQATGVDARGRKQYVYHSKWRERRDQRKFDSMLDFARSLPAMRRRVAKHLAEPGLTRRRVLACSVRLLDRGFFRVGGEDYKVENETYGLATMHTSHVTLDDGTLTFDYRAKSGRRRVQSIVDPAVYDIVAQLKRRRGDPELLAYRDGRSWRDIKSADVTAYVKEVTRGDFTAKDFRTWSATVLAAWALNEFEAFDTKAAAKHNVTQAIERTAARLGNTPAICRKSYVHPEVVNAYLDGSLVESLKGEVEAELRDELAGLRPEEVAVLAFLQRRLAREAAAAGAKAAA